MVLTDMAGFDTAGAEAPLGMAEDAADAPMTGPLRRCIVTREVLPKELLVRFVVGPAGDAIPDIAGELPGRGLWVKAERPVLASAVAKNLFAKAARRAIQGFLASSPQNWQFPHPTGNNRCPALASHRQTPTRPPE